MPLGLSYRGYYLSGATPRLRMDITNDENEFVRDIVAAFHDMKLLTDWNVEMFDVRAANQWCRQHKSICDSPSPSSYLTSTQNTRSATVFSLNWTGRIAIVTIKAIVDT